MICYKLVLTLTSAEKQRKKMRSFQNWLNYLTDWFWILKVFYRDQLVYL